MKRTDLVSQETNLNYIENIGLEIKNKVHIHLNKADMYLYQVNLNSKKFYNENIQLN